MKKADVGPHHVPIANGHMTIGGATIKMRVGRRIEYFEMHRFFGPMRTTKDGDGRDVWPENHPFWPLFERWQAAGMLMRESGYAHVPEENEGRVND